MKKEKKLIKKISFAIALLIIFLLVLLAINFDWLNSFNDLFNKPQLFKIEDNCGIAVGNLIHEIKSMENCRIMCINECRLREMSFIRVEFYERNDSCSECNCYCK